MSEHTLRVVALLQALPDKTEEVKALLLRLIEPTHQEEGCISYELLLSNNDPTDFVFVEEWTSDAALDMHLATPHLQAALPTLQSITSSVDIRRYSKIGG